VVWPFLTGKVPDVVSDSDTVVLFPALGCLPPLLAVSTWSATVVVGTVLPSPTSLKDTRSAPVVLVAEFAKRKCGLSPTLPPLPRHTLLGPLIAPKFLPYS
jgi:hypothetical protein